MRSEDRLHETPGGLLRRIGEDERGMVSVEALFVSILLLVPLVVALFLHQISDARSGLVIATRTAAMNEATNATCGTSMDPFSRMGAIVGGPRVVCGERDEESEMAEQRKFWTVMDRAARPFPELLRDVKPEGATMGVYAQGHVSVRPLKLGQGGFGEPSRIRAETQNFVPSGDFWRHHDEPWKAAYDPILWETLRQQGTWQLFPNVFPAAQTQGAAG